MADLVTTLQLPTAEQEAVIARLGHLQAPPLAEDPFHLMADGGHQYLDVRAICRHHYETTFRFGNAESRAVLPTWQDDDPLGACYSVLYGAYRAEPDRSVFQQHFLEGLSGETIPVAELHSDREVFTPLGLTGDQLRPSASLRVLGAVVGAVDDAAALLTFWNLRAAGAVACFWPATEQGALTDLTGQRLRTLVERRNNRRTREFRVWLADRGSDVPPRLAALLQELGADPVCVSFDAQRSGDPSTAPCVWQTDVRPVLANIDSDNTTKRIFVPLAERPFSSATTGFSRPQWLVTLGTFRSFDLGDHTLNLPWIAALNPWASEKMVFASRVRTGSDGVALFADVADTSVEVRLVHRRDVLKAVLDLAGISAETSPAGEAANRIITRLGGLMGCRHLRLHGVRKVLSSQSALTFQDALRAIHDDGAFSRYRNVRSAPDELRVLLEKEALRPVLWLECPQCRVSTGFAPAELGDEIVCPRCGETFRLGPALPPANWKFRPSGFFADLKRHGAIPVVLTMIRLHDTMHMSDVLLDGSLDVSGPGLKGEIDCIAMWRSRNDRPVLAIAEAKGGKQELAHQDVADLVAVADAVRELGIECYVVVATTRPSLDADEAAMLAQWRERFRGEVSLDPDSPGPRLGPLILTADQLDYFEAFPREALETMPARYVTGMPGLAANLDAVHFGDGPDVQALRSDNDCLI